MKYYGWKTIWSLLLYHLCIRCTWCITCKPGKLSSFSCLFHSCYWQDKSTLCCLQHDQGWHLWRNTKYIQTTAFPAASQQPRVQSHLVSSSWRMPCTPRTRTPRSGSRSPRRRTRGTAACWPRPPPWRCPAAVRWGAAALCWYSHCGRWWTRWWRSTAGCRARRASSCSVWSRPAMQCPHFKTPKMQENIQSVLINIYSWLLDIWDVWSWVTELHFVIVNFCIISYFSF